MLNFKTVDEISTEWNMSTRYIQLLCRQGKIEGAVKRAGIWFIPIAAANPARAKKSNERYLIFSGTKKKIFEKAVELFAIHSYEVITIKDITDAIGIRQSAMYNHFKSKQEILDTIYAFYCHYFPADRPTLEELEPLLRNGSLTDIMNCTLYSFKPEYEALLIDITKIMFYRIFIDERAKELVQKYTIDEGIEFVKSVFDKAVEIGRLAPLDTQAMALLLNSVRTFIFQVWIVNPSPEIIKKWFADEQRLLKHAAKLLTDLKPPNKNLCS